MTVRFSRSSPCPVCNGYDNSTRGAGQRCYGYLSDDGKFAHCTRSESAGSLPLLADSNTYCHVLTGPCNCGARHDGQTAAINVPPPTAQIVATYDYHDASGKVIHQTVRLKPKRFKQRRPDGHGGWIWDLKGVTPVLYRLPEILKSPTSATVFVAEGERDVDRLSSLGLVSTCNPMGAGKWRSEYAKHLKGRHVVIIPDNDGEGITHAEKVAESIKGTAASVKIVLLPDLPPKKGADVSDWLDSGKTVQELEQLTADTPEWEPPAPIATPKPTEDFPLTDLGNAERLVAQHGADLRYCHPRQKWYVWTGTHWREDDTAAVERMAKATVRAIYAEAADETDDNRRAAIVKHARQSEASNRIAAMISLAESELGIPVLPSELDADPWLLNCKNGTLDLISGDLKPHSQTDLITRIAPVEHDPDARSDVWETFLETATDGNKELQAFLQRATGYALTGDTREEVLLFVHGPTGTGKSTFVEAVKSILGPYATTADFESFLARRENSGPRNDIAKLANTRLVTSVEVDEGKRLAQGLVKALTGRDTITARFLHQEFFDFLPTFKLWLCANHAPKVDNRDDAIWRRILLVPFVHSIPKDQRDPNVKATLRDPSASGAAILAWAARGCLEWQKHGLGVPPIVQTATENYRRSMDRLAGFIAECCVVDPQAQVKSSVIREAYEEWCKENGDNDLLRGTAWANQLRAYGCEQDRGTGGIRVWRGIRLLLEDEEPQKNSDAVTQVTPESYKSEDIFLHEGDLYDFGVTECHYVTNPPLNGEAPPFTPTHNWQEVPDGTILPPGLELRMDLAIGKNYARLPLQAASVCPTCQGLVTQQGEMPIDGQVKWWCGNTACAAFWRPVESTQQKGKGNDGTGENTTGDVDGNQVDHE